MGQSELEGVFCGNILQAGSEGRISGLVLTIALLLWWRNHMHCGSQREPQLLLLLPLSEEDAPSFVLLLPTSALELTRASEHSHRETEVLPCEHVLRWRTYH